MIAISASFLTNNAIDMHECGKLCTKFSVPSTGSIIHVGLSVNSHLAPSLVDSSPIKLQIDEKNYVLKMATETPSNQMHIVNEPMMWEFSTQCIDQQFLNFLIRFGDQINVTQFLLDTFTLPKAAGNQLKWNKF